MHIPTRIYNSRNLLMKFEMDHLGNIGRIYNSRNLLMKFELKQDGIKLSSTTVEIY